MNVWSFVRDLEVPDHTVTLETTKITEVNHESSTESKSDSNSPFSKQNIMHNISLDLVNKLTPAQINSCSVGTEHIYSTAYNIIAVCN